MLMNFKFKYSETCTVCHSVLLSETLNFSNNFWTVSARAVIFHMNIPCDKTIIFYPVTLTLEFDSFFENFNFANNFWYFTWVFLVVRSICWY